MASEPFRARRTTPSDYGTSRVDAACACSKTTWLTFGALLGVLMASVRLWARWTIRLDFGTSRADAACACSNSTGI